MEEDIGLGEVIQSFIEYCMQNKFTILPAVVLKVHNKGSQQLLDCQPCVSIKNRDGTVTQQATVLNVPYQQPASSLGGTVFPVNVGDNVLLCYSMRGIDTWKYGSGGLSASSDYRMFSPQDAIAIPCIFPTSKSIASTTKHSSSYELGDTIVFNQGNEVILKANGDIIVNSKGKITTNCVEAEVNASSSVVVNTNSVTVDSPSSTFTGSVNVMGHLSYQSGISGRAGSGSGEGNSIIGGFSVEGGSITHDGKNIGSTHTHSGVETGGGTTGGPT